MLGRLVRLMLLITVCVMVGALGRSAAEKEWPFLGDADPSPYDIGKRKPQPEPPQPSEEPGRPVPVRAALVIDGKPNAAIVLADRPTRSARIAAAELREHLRLMSGAKLPTVPADELPVGVIPIYVGESAATREMGLTSSDFAPQEYLVRVTDDMVVLIGRDDPDFGQIDYEKLGAWDGFNFQRPFYRLGTLHAAYDLLESYGVRWYMVTDVGRVVPEMHTIPLKPMELRNRPWTLYRNTSKNGWQALDEMPVPNEVPQRVSRRDENLHVLRTRLGGEPYGVGHSVWRYYRRFGEEHPEWFVGGNAGPGIQLRYDNPEVAAQVVEDAATFFGWPFQKRRFGRRDEGFVAAMVSAGDNFAVVPDDNRNYGENTNPPLQPERSGRGFGTGRASNYIFTFVNKVAREVAKVHPEKWIASIAYADTFEPPDFAMEPNVTVTVCMADGWADDSYGMEMLREWRPRVSRLTTWEYYIDGLDVFPRVRPHAIANYIKQLEALSVDGLYAEMPSCPGIANILPGLYHLNHYVTYRMLRERAVDIDKLLDEYYTLFYGPAAAPMAHFWATIENAWDDPAYQTSDLGKLAKYWKVLASAERMKSLRDDIKQAKQLAPDDPYKTRIEVIERSALGALEQRRNEYLRVEAIPLPTLTAPKTALKPVLDGKLDDEIWQQAAVTKPFTDLYGNPLDWKTVARVTYDADNLYIALHAEEPLMDKQRLNQRVYSSSVCTDACFELFIEPGRKMKDYLQIIINANGLVWCQWRGKYGRHQQPHISEYGIEGAAWRGADEWSAEVLVPLGIFEESSASGQEWGLGLYRSRYVNLSGQDPRRYSGWSPTFRISYHVKERFGVLRFGE